MVLFGNNPLEEVRKKREMKKAKTLVEKIIQNANKNDLKKSLTNKTPTPTGLKYGMDTSSDIQPMEQLPGTKKSAGSVVTSRQAIINSQGGTALPPPGVNGTTLYNPYLQGKTSPAPAQTPPATDSYYPPPAPKRAGTPGKPNSSINSEELFDPGYGVSMQMPVRSATYDPKRPRKPGNYDMNNIYIAFQGTKAFTRDELGNPIALPDGTYKMPNSNYTIRIANGEKVISN